MVLETSSICSLNGIVVLFKCSYFIAETMINTVLNVSKSFRSGIAKMVLDQRKRLLLFKHCMNEYIVVCIVECGSLKAIETVNRAEVKAVHALVISQEARPAL